MIARVLNEFEIPLKNVIMCVTDIAKNMITTVKALNKDIQAAEEGGEDDDDDKNSSDDSSDDSCEDSSEDEDSEPSHPDLEAACPPICEHMRCASILSSWL